MTKLFVFTYFLLLIHGTISYGQNNLIGTWIQKSIQIDSLKTKSNTKQYLIFYSDGTATIQETMITFHIKYTLTPNSEKSQITEERQTDSTVTYQGRYHLKGDSVYIETSAFQKHYNLKLSLRQLILTRNARQELVIAKDLIIIEEYKKIRRQPSRRLRHKTMT